MDDIWQHREKMFQSFLKLVPRLSKEFPNVNIIVRPHPSEDHKKWKTAARGAAQVHILHEGNVIPWLLAAKVMIHNSCSTGVEAFLLDRQSISFQPFHSNAGEVELPNMLSHAVSSEDELVKTIKSRLSSTQPIIRNESQLDIADNFADARLGDLASDRISEHVLKLHHLTRNLPTPSTRIRLIGNTRSRWRKFNKSIGYYIPESKTGEKHNLHRFPLMSGVEVARKIEQFQATLNRFKNVAANQITENIFLVRK